MEQGWPLAHRHRRRRRPPGGGALGLPQHVEKLASSASQVMGTRPAAQGPAWAHGGRLSAPCAGAAAPWPAGTRPLPPSRAPRRIRIPRERAAAAESRSSGDGGKRRGRRGGEVRRRRGGRERRGRERAGGREGGRGQRGGVEGSERVRVRCCGRICLQKCLAGGGFVKIIAISSFPFFALN